MLYAKRDVISRAKAANSTGLTELETWELWSDAVKAGFHKGSRFHAPGFDSYGGGAIYHLKINNYHIEIY